MKKIINGKKYDTNTAKEIGMWENDDLGINYIKETLYQKRTGEFFLHGVGGANTKYSIQRAYNSWTGGEEIIPLDFQSAKLWSEDYLDVDIFEKYFGEVLEDSEKRIVSFSISAAAHEKLKRLASKNEVNFSEMIEKMINEYDFYIANESELDTIINLLKFQKENLDKEKDLNWIGHLEILIDKFTFYKNIV